ncbi:TIR domain-containing protein [Micromonospora zhanjiangensis]|uniref:TIR domain-containing protein n=1 Tax=Micromonospora zhanjiangensis TaxID=1522057 RepID=A0ABV8KR70_9ACTN
MSNRYVPVRIVAPNGTHHSAELDFSHGNRAAITAIVAELGLPTIRTGQPLSYEIVIGDTGDDGQLTVDLREVAPASPPPSKNREAPQIFIGHGGVSHEWRVLKDQLKDHHDYDVFSWESDVRAGRHVAEVIAEMLDRANFALLVHSGEDEMQDGARRARQNVIHETGLFQGKLGLRRTLLLREEACEPFSNVAGIIEIKYSKGSIQEACGPVLAAIRKEFGELR